MTMGIRKRDRNVFRNLLISIGAVQPIFDYEPNFNRKIKSDAERRMRGVDSMSRAHRDLVKEYGYHAVHSFLNYGITDPQTIGYLICAARGITYDTGHFIKENHRPYNLASMDKPWHQK